MGEIIFRLVNFIIRIYAAAVNIIALVSLMRFKRAPYERKINPTTCNVIKLR